MKEIRLLHHRNPSLFPESFNRTRSRVLVERLCSAYTNLRSALELQVLSDSAHRHIEMEFFSHLLHYPFGKRPVVGVLIAFNRLKEYELFGEIHFFNALSATLGSIQKVEHSFYSFEPSFSPFHIAYIEINEPCENWRSLVNERLKIEIAEHIQELIPASFATPNQEEPFHKLSILEGEIRSGSYLPQAVISYEKHDHQDVQFSVVLVRLIASDSIPLKQLFQSVYPNVSFSVVQKGITGKEDGLYKEGNIFKLRFDLSPFFRSNRTVDLYKARQFVAKMIGEILGEFRDFNGRSLQKQFQVLSELKGALGKKGNTLLIEDFYYAFSANPPLDNFPIEGLKVLFSFLVEVREEGTDHSVKRKEEGGYLVQMVKIGSQGLQDILVEAISRFELPSEKTAYSQLILDKILYVGWISTSDCEDEREIFQKILDRCFHSWKFREQNCLRIALKSTNPSLDPRITRSDQSSALVTLLYEGLTRLNEEGKEELALAESVVVSKDERVYTFTLRQAFWSNSDRLIADDFVLSWRKAILPHNDSIHNYLYFPIKNAKRIHHKELPPNRLGVKALDEVTLEVRLEHPMPTLLELLAHWSYLPTHRNADKNPAWAYEADEFLICNGPYKLKRSSVNKGFIMEKNPKYWDQERVKLDRIEVSLVKDVEEEFELFRQNKLDFAQGSPASYLPLNRDYERINYLSSGVYGLFLNTEAFPFNHKEIRQILAGAIDRKKLAKMVGESEAYSLLPPAFSLIKPNKKKVTRSLEEVCEDLSITPERFDEIEIFYTKHPGRTEVIEAIQGMWEKKLRIKTTSKGLEWESCFQVVRSGNFQVAAMGWIPWFSDPFSVLYGPYHYPSASNPARWRNGEYIAAIEQGSKETDSKARNLSLKRGEEILEEECPVIPLFTLSGHYFKSPSLKGISAGKLYEFNLRWCYFEDYQTD